MTKSGLPPRYLPDPDALEQYRQSLKSTCCPHCGEAEQLISHGFLRGYAEAGSERVIRGRRFFCSNRHQRRGCGRTFSILLAQFLRRCIISAESVGRFLAGVCQGQNRKTAWEHTHCRLSLESAYRIAKRVQRMQSRLRTLLCRKGSPPASRASDPLCQVLGHLQQAFARTACPVAAFQVHFQQPFLV